MARPARVTTSDLIQDVGLIGLSIVAAIFLARSGVLHDLLSSFSDAWLVGAFVAGIFFTSMFTAAPAAAAILLIAQDEGIWLVALVAALGSLLGDFLLFWFARDRLSYYLKEHLQKEIRKHHLSRIFHMHSFRWIAFVLGGLIIASPLPDELGIAILGFARLGSNLFVPLSFVANFLGLVAIGYAILGA
jgi:membrane protein YqaA with SNARE-associated domain